MNQLNKPTGTSLVIAFLFLGLVGAAISAAVIMWCFDEIHGDVPSVPAIGYWASFALFVLAATLGQAFKGVELNKS